MARLKILKHRHLIQALGATMFNSNFKGFFEGNIYKGNLKSVCIPVLNCYSCPGAIFSCPIGSLQAVENSTKFSLSFYILGLMGLFGILAGRFFCGYLCPFGFFQDLLYKIKVKKFKLPKKASKVLSLLKYFILAIMVFLLPILLSSPTKISDPYFCKYLCPSGTIFGGIPLALRNVQIRNAIGSLFFYKLTIAILIIVLSIILYRFFCRYLCPLGAFLGIFNPISFYRLSVSHNCIDCKKCQAKCKFDIPTYKTPNSPECIRCNDCVKVCPVGAIKAGVKHDDERDYSANL
ncbi:MAG: 4Fe-4S binding protein [Tissierellia bacterium]|nr:4Fe-4S binding protein [Tissierellia bacterium]